MGSARQPPRSPTSDTGNLFGRRESRVNEQGVDVRGAQQSACELPSVPPGPGCEDDLFFRLATEEIGQRPDETPVEGRARDVVSRHLRLCRLGEGLPPAREVIERLVPQYAVAVIVNDGDLGEVYRLHTPPPFKASRGRDSSIRPAAETWPRGRPYDHASPSFLQASDRRLRYRQNTCNLSSSRASRLWTLLLPVEARLLFWPAPGPRPRGCARVVRPAPL